MCTLRTHPSRTVAPVQQSRAGRQALRRFEVWIRLNTEAAIGRIVSRSEREVRADLAETMEHSRMRAPPSRKLRTQSSVQDPQPIQDRSGWT